METTSEVTSTDPPPDTMSFEERLEGILSNLESWAEAGNIPTKAYKVAILTVHNQAIRSELQALASSDNWRVRLEDRIAALDPSRASEQDNKIGEK